MEWKKLFALFALSFCLCYGLSPLKQASASDIGGTIGSILSNAKCGVYVRTANNQYYIYTMSSSVPGTFNIDNNRMYYSISNIPAIYQYWILGNNDPLNNLNGNYDYMSSSNANSYNYTSGDLVIVLKGTVNITTNNSNVHGSLTEYEESIAPKWYENAWDTFVDYFTNPVPFQWFKNLINRVFDDDDETTIADNVNLTNPTLTPAPTPIPYSTVVIPKTDINTGETYYETNYIYEGPSGSPIVQPYPPTIAPSGNAGGSSDNYYPVDGEPLKLPKLKWINPVTIGDSSYDGIDSIYDGLSSVDDIGSEYTDGISAVSDATSVLPTKWLMLIGIAAAIPLLAGIISRFLS